MRTPNMPPPEVSKRIDDALITETRRYRVITPLFGGGVKPGEADPVTVVRATEVRGHLRFWWRATRGGEFNGNLAAMKAMEERIWGSAAAQGKPGPSLIQIRLTTLESGKPFQAVDRHGNSMRNIGHPNSVDSYAAFPLRDKDNPHVIEGVEFELSVTFPREINGRDITRDVMAALWAWETFGGIGARTRRGFGALRCTHENQRERTLPSASQLRQEIGTGLSQHLAPGSWPSNVPHLSTDSTRYVFSGNGTPLEVWRELIRKLRSFRQSRQGFHRSKWPEPDEIRRRTRTHKSTHAPVHPIRKFPRAAFGLPIIFEFKRQDVPPEPWKTTLQGANHERLASPLILRPVACAGQNRSVGIAVVLEAPTKPPGGWLLKDAPVHPTDPPIDARLVTKAEANAIEPLKNVGGETNVLLAFLKSL